ncbi:GNAT family N-acetyltransferase [Erysipelothrix sp. HDW6A]|uniref:GNAT family N-acetyltransferase n=1 Tax=Erysipelothrix sp. HDW6A TaxID=2714928 RepID=UPI00140A7C9D|nr:GNAT family N-acetyltransferase [Erysipelothrix sp. HDW6A]QIK58066.1 GNAT family N-acetyltransferase [Erysipelothrix sp. HDW6A]
MTLIRYATLDDLDEIMLIIMQAKQSLKEAGIPQWQTGSPNEATICHDIHNNHTIVMCEEDRIIATVALLFEEEPSYKTLKGGSWLQDNAYATIHRIAVASNATQQSIATSLINHCIDLTRKQALASLRIDTHTENTKMLGLIRKFPFEKCGMITLSDGSPRLAFEMLV